MQPGASLVCLATFAKTENPVFQLHGELVGSHAGDGRGGAGAYLAFQRLRRKRSTKQVHFLLNGHEFRRRPPNDPEFPSTLSFRPARAGRW